MDTTKWLMAPESWRENKGDPGFSDQRLANIQFAASLQAAGQAGIVTNRAASAMAARLLVSDQASDGSWPVEAGNPVGSPATYGTALATFMALAVLEDAGDPEFAAAVHAAEQWLGKLSPGNVPAAATILMVFGETDSKFANQQVQLALDYLQGARTTDGAWGPYRNSRAEIFDTAMVLLALNKVRAEPGVMDMILCGRRFLITQQSPDGSWEPTTRPSGGHSYAQKISATAWATIALMETAPGHQ